MSLMRVTIAIALFSCVEGLLTMRQPSGKNWVVALDRDMKTKMLVQLKSKQTLAPDLALPKDPCANLECEPLECPGGFTVTEAEGHCCPYCTNPELSIDRIIKGPSGEFGGKLSVFCKNVWCFPTMCSQAEEMPTGGNDSGTVCC